MWARVVVGEVRTDATAVAPVDDRKGLSPLVPAGRALSTQYSHMRIILRNDSLARETPSSSVFDAHVRRGHRGAHIIACDGGAHEELFQMNLDATGAVANNESNSRIPLLIFYRGLIERLGPGSITVRI